MNKSARTCRKDGNLAAFAKARAYVKSGAGSQFSKAPDRFCRKLCEGKGGGVKMENGGQ
jgi:hypothetical protein